MENKFLKTIVVLLSIAVFLAAVNFAINIYRLVTL